MDLNQTKSVENIEQILSRNTLLACLYLNKVFKYIPMLATSNYKQLSNKKENKLLYIYYKTDRTSKNLYVNRKVIDKYLQNFERNLNYIIRSMIKYILTIFKNCKF